jgi:hypothetical protein
VFRRFATKLFIGSMGTTGNFSFFLVQFSRQFRFIPMTGSTRRISMKQVKVALALTLCSWLTQFAAAQTLPANATNFPMIGITRGQTLQLNVVAFPVDPCFAQLGFQNSSGNPVGPTTTVTLQAGQSASLALNGNSLTDLAGKRVEVLPTVVLNPSPSPDGCQASVEVFDNVFGITSVLVPGAVGYPSSPELGMLGVTVLQTVRLNVVAYPIDPCVGQISFINSNGELIGNSLMSVNLSPGQAAFLDLPGSTLVTKLGQRTEVQPVVTPDSLSGAPNACVVSAEVYTNGLGTTASFFPVDPCGPSSISCAVF